MEDAIRESAFLLALLSPDSVRPEGICREELCYALANNISILLIRIADVARPLEIAHLNCLDASTDPGSVFTLLPCILNLVREKAHSEKTTQVPAGKWWEEGRDIAIHEDLKRFGCRFTGRDWLFDQLECLG